MHMMTCQILVLGQNTRGVTSLPGGRGGGPSRVEPSGHTGGDAARLGFRLCSGRLGWGRRENARCGRLDGVTGSPWSRGSSLGCAGPRRVASGLYEIEIS